MDGIRVDAVTFTCKQCAGPGKRVARTIEVLVPIEHLTEYPARELVCPWCGKQLCSAESVGVLKEQILKLYEIDRAVRGTGATVTLAPQQIPDANALEAMMNEKLDKYEHKDDFKPAFQ